MCCPSCLFIHAMPCQANASRTGLNTPRLLFYRQSFNSLRKNKDIIWQKRGLELDIQNLGAFSSSENDKYNHDEQDNPKYH